LIVSEQRPRNEAHTAEPSHRHLALYDHFSSHTSSDFNSAPAADLIECKVVNRSSMSTRPSSLMSRRVEVNHQVMQLNAVNVTATKGKFRSSRFEYFVFSAGQGLSGGS
jgi:hypothetical protein